MPVMEYEGNESWDTTRLFIWLWINFGPSNKLKRIYRYPSKRNCGHLDVALNHAFGRNPMVRMWMNDPDGDGWGSPTAETLISIPQLNIAIMWVRISIISCQERRIT
jgi:hypothetical protein